MVLRKKLSCLWTLGLCLVASKSSAKVPAITDQHFKDQCLHSHNELRGKVWPPAADMKHMVRKNGSGIFFLWFILRYLWAINLMDSFIWIINEFISWAILPDSHRSGRKRKTWSCILPKLSPLWEGAGGRMGVGGWSGKGGVWELLGFHH